jgi:transcription elongation factor Elf1|tara:strand:- start:596 stop:817 length:222 start_codon:yes stop_codon:yes gene_type:complete
MSQYPSGYDAGYEDGLENGREEVQAELDEYENRLYLKCPACNSEFEMITGVITCTCCKREFEFNEIRRTKEVD